MTEVNTPPPKSATHYHVPTWVAVVIGGLVVLAAGFVLGRVVGPRRTRVLNGRPGPFVNHPGARFLGLLLLLVVVAVVVVAIVLAVRHFSTRDAATVAPAGTTTESSGAEEILRMRFARGEIDEDEFRRRRDELRG